MSESITALQGASASGAIDISDAGPVGMITLRANLADGEIRQMLSGAGVSVPDAGKISGDLSAGAAWMSPDEMLVFCNFDAAEAQVDALTQALSGTHNLVQNVSDARATIRLSGDDATVREVLAKLTPADVSPNALVEGHFRRTRFAQVAAAFWIAGPGEARVVCFRSVADYVFALLENASGPGSEVGYFG